MKKFFTKYWGMIGMVVLWLVIFAGTAWAQDSSLGLNQFAESSQLGSRPLVDTVARVINGFLGILGVVVVGYIIYGGWLWMSSGGDEEKITEAKAVLRNAIIGLVIILSSFAVANFIISRFEQEGVIPSGGGSTSGGGGGGVLSSDALRVRAITPNETTGVDCFGRAGDAKCAPRNATILITFNQAINPVLVKANNFMVTHTAVLADNTGAVLNPKGGGAGLVTGTVKMFAGGNDRTIMFQPTTDCGASAPASERCFSAWGAFTVEVKPQVAGAEIRTPDNKLLQCLSDECKASFNTNDKVDLEAPRISLTAPPNQSTIFADSFVRLSATATDDGGVAGVLFSADDIYIPDSQRDQPTVDSNYDYSWNTAGVPLGAHTVAAKAWDLTGKIATATPRTVYAFPSFCTNNTIDADKGETGLDCGGSCPVCSGGSCTANYQCSSGLCSGGKCLAVPVISVVGPSNGAVGTFVTILGQDFGAVPGQVIFLGADKDGNGDVRDTGAVSDDVLASAPSACASVTAWTNQQILVAVPTGAVSGPLMVIEAASGQNFWDRTDNDRGWRGDFTINNVTRPGLCSVKDSFGPPGKSVTLTGTGFGPAQASSQVLFGATASDTGAWTGQQISATVPFLQPISTTVAVKVVDKVSNPLAFQLDPSPVAAPVINSIDPKQAPPGQMITIHGSGFGRETGNVFFLRGSEKIPSEGLPAACGTAGWNNTQVIAKIPAGLSVNDQIKVVVQRKDPNLAESNHQDYTLAGPARPSLCALDPVKGPPGTVVTLAGDKLGNQTGDVKFFEDVKVGKAAISAWSNTGVVTSTPAAANSGPVQALDSEATLSNPLNFEVGYCEIGQTNSCPSGSSCCGDGTCRASCPVVATSAQCTYSWAFSTSVGCGADADCGAGQVCNTDTGQCTQFQVVEDASCTNNTQSPSPFKNVTVACAGAQISARFNAQLATPAKVAQNVSVRACNLGDQLDNQACSTAVAVSAITPFPSGDGFIFRPAQALVVGSWYQATITGGASGLKGPRDAPLDGNVNGTIEASDDYVWYFQVGNDQNACRLTSVMVNPRAASVAVASQQPYLALAQAANCELLNENNYTWAWSSSDPGRARVEARTAPNTPATGVAKTLPAQPVAIKAGIPAERLENSGALTVTETDPNTCTTAQDCMDACPGAGPSSAYQCIAGHCQPIVNDFDPSDGRPGTWVVIDGCFFGSEPGRVVLLGEDGSRDDRDALFPPADICGDTWTNNRITIEVPKIKTSTLADDASSGPLIVISNYQDLAGRPLASAPDQEFAVNDATHTTVCRLDPNHGKAGDAVAVYGQNFGDRQPDDSRVLFSGKAGVIPVPVPAASISQWTTNRINTSILADVAGIKAVDNGSAYLNAQVDLLAGRSTSNVLQKAFVLDPFITSITPDKGPAGTWVTIRGGNFGSGEAGRGTVQFADLAEADLPAYCGASWTDTEIIAKAPDASADFSGLVHVTTRDGLTTKDQFSKSFSKDARLPLPPGLCVLGMQYQCTQSIPAMQAAYNTCVTRCTTELAAVVQAFDDCWENYRDYFGRDECLSQGNAYRARSQECLAEGVNSVTYCVSPLSGGGCLQGDKTAAQVCLFKKDALTERSAVCSTGYDLAAHTSPVGYGVIAKGEGFGQVAGAAETQDYDAATDSLRFTANASANDVAGTWTVTEIKGTIPPAAQTGPVVVHKQRTVNVGERCTGIELFGQCYLGNVVPVRNTVPVDSNPITFTRLDGGDNSCTTNAQCASGLCANGQCVEFYVEPFVPTCASACPNGRVGFGFNRNANSATVTTTTAQLFKCQDETCTKDKLTGVVTTTLAPVSDGGVYYFALSSGTSLSASSRYRVVVKGGESGVKTTDTTPLRLSRLNYDSDATLGFDSFSWTFQTAAQACQVDRVVVSPTPATIPTIIPPTNTQIFAAQPFSPPTACSASGELLDPYAYDWQWTAAQTSVATISTVKRFGNGVREYGEQCDDGNRDDEDGCSSQGLFEGTNQTHQNITYNAAGERTGHGNCRQTAGCPVVLGTGISSVLACTVPYNGGACTDQLCGNGRLDPGEACDLSIYNLTNGGSSACTNRCLLTTAITPLSEFITGVQVSPYQQATARAAGTTEIKADPVGVYNVEFANAQLQVLGGRPLQITHIIPAHASTNICPNGLFEVGFDQRINITSLASGLVLEKNASAVPVTVAVREAGDRFVFATACASAAGCPITVGTGANVQTLCTVATGGTSCLARGTDEGQVFSLAADCNDNAGCPIRSANNLTICTVENTKRSCRANYSRSVVTVTPQSQTYSLSTDASDCNLDAGCPIVISGQVVCTVAKTRRSCTSEPVLFSSAQYRLKISGGATGVKNLTGVPLQQIQTVPGLVVDASKTIATVNFTTLNKMCTVDAMQIWIRYGAGPGGYVETTQVGNLTDTFTCRTDSCSDDFDTAAGNQHRYRAQAYFITPGGLGYQSIQASYTWSLARDNGVVALSPSDQDPQQRLATAGTPTVTPQDIVSVRALGLGVGAGEHSNTITVDSFLCQNPWPATVPYQYRDLPTGSDPGLHFSLQYCRDRGTSNLTDDLPALAATAVVGQGQGQLEVARELFFPVVDSTDVIGVRVFYNSERVSLRQWYEARNLGGNPQVTTIDGYRALRDGNTLYVEFTNLNFNAVTFEEILAKPYTLGSYVMVLSINDGASQDTQEIFTQLVSNLAFNINLPDGGGWNRCVVSPDAVARGTEAVAVGASTCSVDRDCASGQVCYATKLKLQRDLKRLSDLVTLAGLIEQYKASNASRRCSATLSRACVISSDCPSGEQCVNTYPILASGSYVNGLSVSTWPSWQAELANTLGFTLPQDPSVGFAGKAGFCTNATTTSCAQDSECAGTTGPCTKLDPASFWNQQQGIFWCPARSQMYQYQSVSNHTDFKVMAEFELLGTATGIQAFASGKIQPSGICNSTIIPGRGP